MFTTRRAVINGLALVVGLATLEACSADDTPVRDAVLAPGQMVEAANSAGKVRISYVSAKERRYDWDGESRTITMIARDEPFLGKLGLYDPADGLKTPLRAERLVVQESKLRFSTRTEAYEFLWPEGATKDWAFLGNGMVVGFARVPARNQISIDLFQVIVDGKPAGLERSEFDRFSEAHGR